MLSLRGLSRRYGQTVALDSLSLDVPEGEVVGFVGPNGAGKTTAMRIGLGVLEQDAGEVLWRGQPATRETQRGFGYMPEERGLYPKMRVGRQLRYLATLHGRDDAEADTAASRWIERLGIADRAGQRVEELSLGNQQRVQLAAALVHDPDVLILDEPFSGLDPIGTDVMSGVLHERAEAGAAVIFSSHQLELVERLCDSVAIVNRGRIVAAGRVEELRSERSDPRLRVQVEGASADWFEGLHGVELIASDDPEVVLELHEGADDQQVLDRGPRADLRRPALLRGGMDRSLDRVEIARMNRIAAPLMLLVALLAVASPVAAAPYLAGSSGSGDPFFPLAGNGGYDVHHYSLRLAYDQPANSLEGSAVIRARATENLYRFDLDLRDFLAVSRVTVNFRPASYSQEQGQELVITPRRKIKAGERIRISVDYAGTPEPVIDPDEALDGWVPTDDGALVVNEPQGSPGWYPVNDSPRDKATYDFRVAVAEGKTAVANGELVSQRTRGGWTTWHWSQDEPMSPYLATATNGTFLTEQYEANGLFMYDAVDPKTRVDEADPPNPTLAFERLDAQPEIIAFFSDLYGAYPFSAGGGIIDWAPDVGYALESQTRTNYDRIPDHTTVVHEIAHQWFGDAVTLSVWPDIWLNEGFATFSEWIYDERHAGPPAQEVFDELCATPEDSKEGQDLWFPAPAALKDASQLFGTPVYSRGAMTLQALRTAVGDDAFFRILRRWYAQNRYGNVTTADFIALSERVSGQQLDDLFDAWLYEEGRPAVCDS